MAAAVETTPGACFHCGLEVPPGLDLEVELLGAARPMCCIGCLAVAETLKAQGLERWYATREAPSGVPASPVPDVLARSEFLRVAEAGGAWGTRDVAGARETTLLVEGITCAACAWVIERHLGGLEGLIEVRVSSLSHRARVRWDPERCDLEAIVARLAEIGFVARPDEVDEAIELARRERRDALVRIGIAGLATMNVMTYAVALYFGDAQGMSGATRALMRWLCWLVATPVVFVSAAPFFRGALRDLRLRRPGMDVPVALAIAGAYLASGWAVATHSGQVYFESVCMFTLFLSAGRFVEMDIRHRAAARSRQLLAAAPSIARRIEQGREVIVGTGVLAPGDRLRVRPGESVPVDGRVLTGAGSVEEAILTGEPWPRSVEPGDDVRAGSVVGDAPLEIEATSTAKDSTLAALVELIDRAQADKPPIAQRADRVAVRFVSAVLAIAAATAVGWWWIAPERALWVTLSVLVATCPCALGLATPAALAAATEGLARRGFVITRAHALEALAQVDRIVFDKTGTLTRGRPKLEHVVALRPLPESTLVDRARRLETGSSHVLARAFDAASAPEGDARAEVQHMTGSGVPAEVQHVTGRGVEGKLEARRHRLGHPDWVMALSGAPTPAPPSELRATTWILLGDEEGALAWLGIGDPLRPEALPAIEALRRRGLALELLSGDPSPAVAELAGSLGLERERGAARPEEKLDRVRALGAAGERVAFVGDGLNDGPVVQAADVSIVMGGGSDRTRLSADALLWNDDLTRLPEAIDRAVLTQRVIRQNFGWAIAYNACVLPLAITGQLAPWLAAVGMSLSSLVVVANSARLRRDPAEGAA